MKRTLSYSAAGLILLLLLLGASAFAITVTVNDQPLPASPPAIERNGRVLLPMREVFESLGATVLWQAATQTITAQRGDQMVRMAINQPVAYINDEQVTLDVPPRLIGGLTYVPVRFPAEAFGADVRWFAPQQLVSISLAEANVPPAPVPTPTPAPVPTAGEVTGVVAGVTGTRLALQVDSRLESYTLTPGTVVLRQGRQVLASQLQPGDLVDVQYDARGLVTVVQASYGTVAGRIESISGRQLFLDTYGQPLTLQPGATVTGPGGQRLTLRDLRPGDRVVVRITPDTSDAYNVALATGGVPGQTLTITHNATGPLLPGETITVHATGPAGSHAWFDLGTLQRNIALQEVRPGVYEGSYVIPPVSGALTESVVVHLVTPQGREMQATAQAPLRIAMARALPRVVSPTVGQRVGDRVVVEGYAEPLSDVVVNIDWQGQVPGSVPESGRLASTTVTSDERGYFRTPPLALSPPRDVPLADLSYSLTVASRTANGALSAPLQIALNP